jgi:hypothetical protein
MRLYALWPQAEPEIEGDMLTAFFTPCSQVVQ